MPHQPKAVDRRLTRVASDGNPLVIGNHGQSCLVSERGAFGHYRQSPRILFSTRLRQPQSAGNRVSLAPLD